MIFPRSFRRPFLTLEDWLAVTDLAVTRRSQIHLACHKGNASQEQKSQQVGAQSQGAAVTGGDGTVVNTGSQIIVGKTSPDGFSFGQPASAVAGPVDATIINGLDGDAVNKAVKELADAFSSSSNNAVAAVADAAKVPAATAAAANPADHTQLLNIAASVATVVGVGYLIFNRKKS